jgi:plasmid stabilization system protein ParE
MSGFVFHPEASADLEEIWDFIAADNIEAADRVLDEIGAAIENLASFPESGHSRGDLCSRPLKFTSCESF